MGHKSTIWSKMKVLKRVKQIYRLHSIDYETLEGIPSKFRAEGYWFWFIHFGNDRIRPESGGWRLPRLLCGILVIFQIVGLIGSLAAAAVPNVPLFTAFTSLTIE